MHGIDLIDEKKVVCKCGEVGYALIVSFFLNNSQNLFFAVVSCRVLDNVMR